MINRTLNKPTEIYTSKAKRVPCMREITYDEYVYVSVTYD